MVGKASGSLQKNQSLIKFVICRSTWDGIICYPVLVMEHLLKINVKYVERLRRNIFPCILQSATALTHFFFENEGVSCPSEVSYPQVFEPELWVPACHMRFPATAVHID